MSDQYQAPLVQPSNGLAIASMVLGIVSLFVFWIPFLGWLPVVTGLALGAIALQRREGRGMAITGVVLSGLTLLLKLWFWAAIIGAIGVAASHHA